MVTWFLFSPMISSQARVLGGPAIAECPESPRDNRRQPPTTVWEVYNGSNPKLGRLWRHCKAFQKTNTYYRWQPRARYRQSLDPTVEEVMNVIRINGAICYLWPEAIRKHWNWRRCHTGPPSSNRTSSSSSWGASPLPLQWSRGAQAHRQWGDLGVQ